MRLSARSQAWPGSRWSRPSAGPGTCRVSVVPLIALHRSYLAQLRGDAEGTAAFASTVLPEASARASARRAPSPSGTWPVAERPRGWLAEAGAPSMSGVTGWRAAGQPTLTAYGADQLGQVQRAQGHLDATVQDLVHWARISPRRLTSRRRRLQARVCGPAEVAYQRDELDTALRYVTEGIALCRQFVYTAPLAGGLATLAWTAGHR